MAALTGPGLADGEHHLPGGLVVPAYAGAYLGSLVPALQAPRGERPGWLPPALAQAGQVVLLVLDGLGWEQLAQRKAVAPLMSSMDGCPITSVAPTTTATALSSLTLGMAPAAHGIVGYKFALDGPSGREVLNVLRWTTSSGDARSFAPPARLQQEPAFGGCPVPVVSRADFSGSGFTAAHQRGAREVGWVVPSSMALLVRRLLGEREPFVYAYYDGVDKVAHATGLGELYDGELAAVDRLVGDMLAALPTGAALAVVADHGQVEVGGAATFLPAEVVRETTMTSGDARFRWLHCRPGRTEALLGLLRELYAGRAWVATRAEVVDAGLFGGPLQAGAWERLGDIALVPLDDGAYLDPRDAGEGEARLVCRHGGLSSAEMLVPLLAAAA